MTPTLDYSSGPDWNANSEAVLCPMCDYNLRGISEPRCPECGFTFKWEELLDPVRRRHRFLFEQQQFHRARTFCKTLIAGLRPRQFWGEELHPIQPSRPARLLAYWLIAIGIAIIGIALASAAEAVSGGRSFSRAYYFYQTFLAPGGGSWGAYLPRGGVVQVLWPIGVLIVWPLLTMAAMMVFRISLQQARLRTHHIVRCIVYSADCVAWLGVSLVLLAVVWAVLTLLDIELDPKLDLNVDMDVLIQRLIAIFGLLFIYRLARAYQLYMRFDHPVLTVLASQVMVGLAWLAIYVYVIAPPPW